MKIFVDGHDVLEYAKRNICEGLNKRPTTRRAFPTQVMSHRRME